MVKIIFMILGGLVFLGIVGLGFFYYSANKVARQKSDRIDELAKIPVGSTVDEVMKLAEKLGFSLDSNEFGVPAAVEMTNMDTPRKPTGIPKKVGRDTDFSNFKNGTLNFGLSLFLFQRKGCEIVFKDGQVQSTRIWALD